MEDIICTNYQCYSSNRGGRCGNKHLEDLSARGKYLDEAFKFTYDEEHKIWHVVIKGIPFTFGEGEMVHLNFIISAELMSADPELRKELEKTK